MKVLMLIVLLGLAIYAANVDPRLTRVHYMKSNPTVLTTEIRELRASIKELQAALQVLKNQHDNAIKEIYRLNQSNNNEG